MRELDQPGAGLPPSEIFFLNAVFKTASVFVSDQRALRMFQREADTIMEIATTIDVDLASRPVLIPRLQGIEDSSRHWSVLMTIDHLNIVNSEILNVITALQKNETVGTVVDVAAYKPNPDVGIEVIDQFQSMNDRYQEMVQQHKPLKSMARHDHPWFGGLDGHLWHCLAAAHMRIHRRQIRKILAVHGIV